MAKLTISDASRVAGVARSTLHRAIRAGRLSIDPDGHVDTAELLRAGYTLQRSTQQSAPGALQDATPRSSGALQAILPLERQAQTVVHQERDLLRLEREQAAQEREALLLHMLEQAQQQSQRLLDMPRTPPPAPPGPGAPAAASAPRGDMRRRIVTLLQEYPEGLSPVQTRRLLGLAKDLGSTMKAMARDGLLRRVETGRYVVA
jgi:hypothetical protein